MKKYISKVLIGLTILATTTWASVARADWVRVLTDQERNTVFYIETSTIQIDNGIYYFWASASLIEPEYFSEYDAEVSSFNAFISTDCSSGDFTIHKNEVFNIEGNRLEVEDENINYSALSRGGIAVKNFVCNR